MHMINLFNLRWLILIVLLLSACALPTNEATSRVEPTRIEISDATPTQAISAISKPYPTPIAGTPTLNPTLTNEPTAPPTLTAEPTASPEIEPTQTPTPPLPTAVTPTAVAETDEMLRLVNLERDKVGCVALERDVKIQLAAQLHAEDMASHNKIDHVGSDGATYSQRLDRVEYGYVRRGENIAAGFGAPAEVVEAWMDEPDDGPHRLNILNCVYRHAGIGLAYGNAGYPYWVLDLAEPKQ